MLGPNTSAIVVAEENTASLTEKPETEMFPTGIIDGPSPNSMGMFQILTCPISLMVRR